VQRIDLPEIRSPHGVVAHPESARLYISYGGQGDPGETGSVLAYDLLRERVLWNRHYAAGIDSIAITKAGDTLYVPAGEASNSGAWALVDTQTGDVRGAVQAGAGAHNTLVSLDGKQLFLAGTRWPYLTVVDTATNTNIRKIGPLVSGGRPFTINGSNTLSFTTARGLLGFQVGSILSGHVLYTVTVPGYTYDPQAFSNRSPCHGISMSPDERELYLIDTPNGYLHVFDISDLPSSRPRYVTSIRMTHPPPNDGWLQHSRDGRFVYVGRAGDVIDTRTREIVAYLPPLAETADFVEIDWSGGRPVATTSRYGLGYRTSG
jgi:DNA-binding beta-propeller fold protein YncE